MIKCQVIDQPSLMLGPLFLVSNICDFSVKENVMVKVVSIKLSVCSYSCI